MIGSASASQAANVSTPEPVLPNPLFQSGFQRLFTGLTTDHVLPYYQGLHGSAEPSLSGLFALAAHGLCDTPPAQALLTAILKLQNPDGSVGATLSLPAEGLWVTSQFAVATHLFRRPEQRDRAIRFLLEFRSAPTANVQEISQNNALIGWPWTQGTFGWVEPTSWAVIALTMSGAADHARAREGRELILDRQITSGGWNCGNRQVYGNDLLPFLDTTGLALLALAGQAPAEKAKPALDWILTLDPTQETVYGLAFALMALRAWNRPADLWQNTLSQRLANDVLPSPDSETLNFNTLALALAALGPAQALNPMAGK